MHEQQGVIGFENPINHRCWDLVPQTNAYLDPLGLRAAVPGVEASGSRLGGIGVR